MSSKANNSINFETTFTNKVSKSWLLFFLSNDILFLDLCDFRANVSFHKLFHTFWDTLLNKRGYNCEFHKKEIEMMVLSSRCKYKSAYALFCSERCLKCFGSDLTFIKKRSGHVASAEVGFMSCKANLSINFQSTFTNEVSKSRLLFSLSNDIWFLDLSDFRADIEFSKVFHIFWDTLLKKKGNNCEFHKKEIEMMVLSSLCK